MRFPTVPLFGFRFTLAPSLEAVAESLLDDVSGGGGGVYELVTPNAAQVVYYNEDRCKAIQAHYATARYVLADGIPVVWTGRLLGYPLQRLAGSDLFPIVWRALKARSVPTLLVLANEHLSTAFQQDYTGATCSVAPFFSASDTDFIRRYAAELAQQVVANRSRLVFLGLGFPKQERLGKALGEELQRLDYPHPVALLLLGASFEFYFGQKKRAPAIFQRLGLEWFYRFMQEPRRLWRRYTVDNVRFLILMLRELFRPRAKKAPSEEGA